MRGMARGGSWQKAIKNGSNVINQNSGELCRLWATDTTSDHYVLTKPNVGHCQRTPNHFLLQHA